MQLHYTPMDAWPPQAWLAHGRSGDDRVRVAHGSRVETQPDWFAEAVWDGDFAAGDFDRTDLVYGTGGRVREDACVFVSSATTVERLHRFEREGQVWVSNSLACLLAAIEADVDPNYDRYFDDFESIIRGLQDYRREIATSAGRVRLTYYHNLQWRNGGLTETAKPDVSRNFRTFARYRGFLEDSLSAIGENMRSDRRASPYEMLATISSGYDSPMVAAVARRGGLRQTLSFASARDGRPDSGAEVARHLGLEPLVVDSNLWRDRPYGEVPFVASDAKGEDVYYGGATDLLHGRVLLTGYGGSRVWDKGHKLMEHFQRGDQSGLSLCEFRLWAGFIHCPVTYMGGGQTQDLRAISNSPEMQPWDVPGDYSRPICRRILEEAGVPRTLFGTEKKAASILLFDRHSFLSVASLDDYSRWLAGNCRRFAPVRGVPAAGRWLRDLLGRSARYAAGKAQRLAAALYRVVPLGLLKRISTSGRLTSVANQEPLFKYLFPWALARAKRRYGGGSPFDEGEEAEQEPVLAHR